MSTPIFSKRIATVLRLLAFFLLSALIGRVSAQTLNLNQFGIEEGLPQSSIYTMLQDKDGNMWVGTMSGVSKYNGLSFENFSKKDGLSENRVTASCLDKDGNIWLGHWSGGISKYNAAAKKFESIATDKVESNKTINCILQDEKGAIWFGTEGSGLLKSDNGTFSSITVNEGLASNIVKALMKHKDGTVWIGTTSGLNVLSSGQVESKDLGLPSSSITALLQDKMGNVWIGTSDKGVCKLSPDNQLKTYNTTMGLAHDHLRVIFEDVNGTIFLGTYGGGASKYLPQLEANGYKGPIFQSISFKQGLSNDRVLSIIQDREKNIWIGTYLNLNQYFDEQFEIYGNNEGLDNSLIWTVIQDKKGNFWVGTEGGLVEFIEDAYAEGENTTAKKTSDITKYRFEKLTGKEGEIRNTSALYEDVKGNIWFTDFGKGLSRLNPATKKIDNYTVEKGGLPVNEIYCIAGDNDGNIWIGTNKRGLLKFDINTEKFEQFTTENGIGSDQIYTIFHDSKNRMWFGTLSGALTMYDGSGFKTFTDKEGYPSKFTLCITEDKEGNIWLGTFDLGIYKYDGSSFKGYTTKEGLSSNTPFLLACDDKNNLWIGSGLGVDRFNLKEETFKHYEKDDGFLGVEINPNAVCKDKDGALWFGSIIGLVKYNSKFEKSNEVEAITTIKNPRLDFKEIEITEDHTFAWYDNHLTFDFIGTSLTNPKRVKYKYMLAGLDSTWSPITKANSVTFPDLKPGDYTFMVKSCNNDGVWNTEPATFHFVITAPFWQKAWFWISCAFAALIIIILFVKWRERKLRKANLILEQKVVERTEVISKQNIELEKKNEKITDSIDYAKRIQQAVFVSAQEMKSYPFESFLFFKAKDIVSGDFYWSHKKNDDIYFMAAADCTGHGVPGAFMSLIGYNMLNYSINDLGLEKPSAVLNMMRNLVRDTLKGNAADEKAMKDGMAMAFCRIDIKSMKLDFSGSYNPLYHLRNGELKEYKAERIPIGHTGESEQDQGSFVDHPVELKKGDVIYMFSDGFADQIGGPNKKKYFYGPFKELLQSISNLPMEEQKKKLDNAITEWMGEREQLDDITVMGVRF